jgi:hypothetical protein
LRLNGSASLNMITYLRLNGSAALNLNFKFCVTNGKYLKNNQRCISTT